MRLPALNLPALAVPAFAAIALSLGACKTPPKPAEFAAGGREQPVLASAQNWHELAESTAATLRPALPPGPVEVEVVTGQSRFETSFGRLLTTALNERGVRIATGGSPWIVHVETQEIPHDDGLRFYSDELVISSGLTRAGIQIAGRSATYYVARSERQNYQQPPATDDKPVYSVRF